MKISKIVSLLVSVFFASITFAQNVSGEWYGVGKVKKAGDHNSYLSEMILKQKGNKVTGEFNYFYRSAEIKTRVTGKYDPRYKVMELNAQPILNYMAKNQNGADCPMEGSFTLKVTKDKITLSGQFNPTYDYRITCPPIDVQFTKSVAKSSKKVQEPVDDEDTVATADVIKQPTTVRRDSVAKTGAIAAPAIANKPISAEEQAALLLKTRGFDESPIIDVDADSLKVSLYDNGEVDNDSISLFYNRKLVASKQMLSNKPLNFTLPLSSSINEIAMFAENLGRIPPNTALAIIYAGEQRFELNLTSTYNKNAAIRFRKKAKNNDPKNIN